MAILNNSSISIRLESNGTPRTTLPSRQLVQLEDEVSHCDYFSYRNAVCAQICSNRFSMLDLHTSNLQTCALLVSAYQDSTSNTSLAFDPASFGAFKQDPSSHLEVMITLLRVIDELTTRGSERGLQIEPSACIGNVSFHGNTQLSGSSRRAYDLAHGYTTTASAVKICLQKVCSAGTLNSDLASIRVSKFIPFQSNF